MNISKRQRDILEFLLRQSHEITAGDIAEEIKVSTRTVHRELSAVEKWLAYYDARLEKKSGIGIFIDAGPNRRSSLIEQLHAAEQVNYSAEERKIYSLCVLLEDEEPIKLLALAADMKVTVATVSSDLDDLESWIEQRGLQLVRRRGYGVQITGEEIDKRRAMAELVLEHLDESDLFGQEWAKNTGAGGTRKLMELMGRSHILVIEGALWQPNEKWLEDLVESKYMELLIQLCITVHRILGGSFVKRSGIWGKDAMSGSRELMVQRLCAELEEALTFTIPDEEKHYIAELFRAAEDESTRLLPLQDWVTLETVRELIRRVEIRSSYQFEDDRLLREGLIDHVQAALHRLNEGRSIRNPLLQQIRRDYERLFQDVKAAVEEMSSTPGIHTLDVPDEEIGFLVMHFGASIERMRQLRREVRAMVVCTSGIGSSRLLATRLAKELPQIQIVDRVSWYEAARIPDESYDLIISTVDLPLPIDRYLKISPLLTQEESDRLRHFIQNITLKKERAGAADHMGGRREEVQWLSLLRDVLDEMVRLLEGFEVFQLGNLQLNLLETLQAVCEREASLGTTERPQIIADLLVERERSGTQLLPDTAVALFHTRSPYISRASLRLYRLEEPLLLETDASSGKVRHILLMLGPRELSKGSLEVLSEISALLLHEEMIRLLETGTREDIIAYMSEQLSEYFRSKIELGRK
ncbi:BglG family transcription antiterminator [Paenibacillus sp. JX-17]|uniref:BglG family transcription antiterminator n=1 Tax=Paenibacillus lacisoli TaxID=3064525 RepID=A0ABT9CFX3_9BACL|nr:BglG family transcription antiterminator [Paenibacillus sp. JX-17]MDO7908152.1 BglG family transcription antiterminator [Paenibacillus sp. JX-17]